MSGSFRTLGKLLGGRAIRTNWATRKGPYSARDAVGGFSGTNAACGTSASSFSVSKLEPTCTCTFS